MLFDKTRKFLHEFLRDYNPREFWQFLPDWENINNTILMVQSTMDLINTIQLIVDVFPQSTMNDSSMPQELLKEELEKADPSNRGFSEEVVRQFKHRLFKSLEGKKSINLKDMFNLTLKAALSGFKEFKNFQDFKDYILDAINYEKTRIKSQETVQLPILRSLCIINLWTIFEVYLKDVIEEVGFLNPEALYSEIFPNTKINYRKHLLNSSTRQEIFENLLEDISEHYSKYYNAKNS